MEQKNDGAIDTGNKGNQTGSKQMRKIDNTKGNQEEIEGWRISGIEIQQKIQISRLGVYTGAISERGSTLHLLPAKTLMMIGTHKKFWDASMPPHQKRYGRPCGGVKRGNRTGLVSLHLET